MTDDRDLSPSDIQGLSSRDALASFFATLGYHTDARIPQTVAAMGITAESLQREVSHIERLAAEEHGGLPLEIYLIELTSVTVAATQGICRALRNRAGNYLLVLTDDYEQLHFVLLERSLPMAASSPMVTRQVSIRPRILTINRRTVTRGSVALRVLRRFTCTEVDADAQYDKLLSAYTVAEWSEPMFNNRALFSDYYLNHRLPDRPEWKDRPEEPYHRLQELMTQARKRLSGQTREYTWQNLLKPALQALGFTSYESVSSSRDAGSYVRLGTGRTLALCLAYPWNRNLDGRDEARDAETPDENPGARAIEILGTEEAAWAIVTNGKVWRLYSAKAHSRASNYYEIDLEETLAMSDPNLAFRYFWLFFRAKAFEPRDVPSRGESCRMSFVEEMVAESEDYAKELGENLKKRVFEEIFPHFARGFIEHLRTQPPLMGAQQGALLPAAQQLALKQEPDEAFRQQLFQATLMFLYRLLFLSYAESRDLLPAREVRGYWEHSLARLKEEIAANAGDSVDEAPGRLKQAYSATSTMIYDHLLHLFGIIDGGSRDMNVPLYNGGLFLTNPDDADRSPEAESARFLLQHKIPDRHLVLGLDRLVRDVDKKRQSLVFMDYKSMGVRHLGSIYEGLLEFKVRVAPEKMAIVQGKRTEEVVPYREAAATGGKVLADGRGREAKERIYQAGDVYLENDRRERKATGSYYTPDHIVKYIVEHAVGPVLKKRLERLRPTFRDAQKESLRKKANAEAFRRQGLPPDDPAKLAFRYDSLVNDLFELRVLDPAMGSGHFLVEAVDFICDRIIGQRDGFLQAFPGNPVTAFLHSTRMSIQAEMERQSVSIDASKLTDINLLKRHVLKRCIYGVDLNPMAVELAKVSLWLDCFTLGAPLSFLDHHLKCGNSLIGTTVREVEAELTAQKKGHVGDLFGGPFQGLLSNTATMMEIARSPDATAEQAGRSRSLYGDFEEDQLPYKRALDLWTSHHFSNTKAREYLTLVGRDFVRELQTEGAGVSDVYREAIRRGQSIAAEKRFFHWDLEFPEAYVDLPSSAWKPKEEQGFHAVVGNPPYDVLSTEELGVDVSADLSFFRSANVYAPAIRGKVNLYKLFICRALALAAQDGTVSMIVPMALLGDDQSRDVRKALLNRNLVAVDSFPQKDDPRLRVFPEAKLSTAVFSCRVAETENSFRVHTHLGSNLAESGPVLILNSSDILAFDASNATIPSCTQRDWDLACQVVRTCSDRRLGWYCSASQGEVNETTDGKRGLLASRREDGVEVVRGSCVSLYVVRSASQGHPIYLRRGPFLQAKPDSVKAQHHLRRRVGWQEAAPQNNFRRVVASMIPAGSFCNHLVNYFPEESSQIPLDLVLALLNSQVIEWYFRLGSTNAHVSHYQVENLPVPSISAPEPARELRQLLVNRQWRALAGQLSARCGPPGDMPPTVVDAVIAMSRAIQEIEAKRVLKNRSERSHLAPESQVIQDVIDSVLFRCYGLSEDDAAYIEQRLKEML